MGHGALHRERRHPARRSAPAAPPRLTLPAHVSQRCESLRAPAAILTHLGLLPPRRAPWAPPANTDGPAELTAPGNAPLPAPREARPRPSQRCQSGDPYPTALFPKHLPMHRAWAPGRAAANPPQRAGRASPELTCEDHAVPSAAVPPRGCVPGCLRPCVLACSPACAAAAHNWHPAPTNTAERSRVVARPLRAPPPSGSAPPHRTARLAPLRSQFYAQGRTLARR